MKKPLNSRDLESLSAFLDNELNTRERDRLEVRLQAEPTLAAELKRLRQTRNLLRNTPQFRAPRSFALTPEMVGQTGGRRPDRWFTLARLTFALARKIADPWR